MPITSMNAPAISHEGIERLRAFCNPTPMRDGDTLFKAGYEECKRQMVERIDQEVVKPAPAKETTREERILSGAERTARLEEAKRAHSPWWALWK